MRSFRCISLPAILLLGCGLVAVAEPPGRATPLARAHAHNDYEHPRPLLDALDQGFCSVEADIFLRDGALLVAHTLIQTRADRTLQKLYLDPLRERVRLNGGRVFPGGPTFTLLVDVKSDAAATCEALLRALEPYADMLCVSRDGRATDGAVQVVVSGNCDRRVISRGPTRLAAIDGRPPDLDGDADVALIPWISASWSSQFRWNGRGVMPEPERAKLAAYVAKAHASKRKVRFWGAPDTAAAWREQRDAGVDLINTDQLAKLREFLTAEPAQGPGR